MNTPANKEELIKACLADPVYFAENYVRLGCDSVTAFQIDSGKLEFFDTVEEENIVIARYPRRFGKTTAIHVYALHQAMFEKKTVAIQSTVVIQQIQFLSDIAVMHRNLPTWLQSNLHETPDTLSFTGGGTISSYGFNRGGKAPDVLLIDEPQKQTVRYGKQWLPDEIISQRTKGKTIFVGSFPKDDKFIGHMWSYPSENWVSLPSPSVEKHIKAVLSMSDPAYSRGY